jgi:hypothetical protein
MPSPSTLFISADHGLAIIYFLQSDLVPTLLQSGVRVVVLTDGALIPAIRARFGQEGLVVEGLRFEQCRAYAREERPAVQYWLDFLRRAGGSKRINLGAVDAYREQVAYESEGRRKQLFPVMDQALKVVRSSSFARKKLVELQSKFTANIYDDLFEKYQPDLVMAATPGWRLDRYLLREATARGIPTAAGIVGWDNPSSYNVPGAQMDYATCWSAIQKDELVLGSDWKPEQVHVGGIPSYDGYFNGRWALSRDDYFQRHGLDPFRKLIAYAASFITFSPNIQNIEALARLVAEDQLAEPAQLLVRLHPNHFLDVPRFAAERERVRAFVRDFEHVHLVEPVSLGGELGHYSGEDMDEKSSMMAHADVFTTVYSTMVVEAACHGTPVVAVTIDHETGWTDKFYLPLTEIGHWPTHQRFLEADAGRGANTIDALREALDRYLSDPQAELQQRSRFLDQEVTYQDGSAGKRTGEFVLGLL